MVIPDVVEPGGNEGEGRRRERWKERLELVCSTARMKQATHEASKYKNTRSEAPMVRGPRRRRERTRDRQMAKLEVSSRGGGGVSLKGDVERKVPMSVVEGQTCDKAEHLHLLHLLAWSFRAGGLFLVGRGTEVHTAYSSTGDRDQ